MHKPVILVILDGWGISNNTKENIIRSTKLPTVEKMNKFYPLTTLQPSGISVGLPWGEVGNSEVGHMTIGAGKIIYQNLPRITLSIQDGSFVQNENFISAIREAKKNNKSLHIMGLIGEGTVHSSIEHLHALLEIAQNEKMEKTYIHAFTDGRDSPPTSGAVSLRNLSERMKTAGIGKIATVCGRNWAMDRNNNWDRIEKAYRMLTEGSGELIADPANYLQKSYSEGITDEYIEPGIVSENGKPLTTIQDGDSVIFFNYREDRARQLTSSFVLPEFSSFKREKKLDIRFITMVEYEKNLPVIVAFSKDEVRNGLGEVLSKNNLKQLRIAETEKYAHVTYFFNGGKEEPWSGEDRILIPSPSVSKFDQAPEMSAAKITEKVIAAIEEKKYDFILINYANADMVGHTGNREACIEAIKSIDKTLSLLIPATLRTGGCLLITADHGNVEEIKNLYTGQTDTEHSANPVPCWLVAPENHKEKNSEQITRQENEIGGLLSDIAPTIIELLGIQKPKEMSGESLLPILK